MLAARLESSPRLPLRTARYGVLFLWFVSLLCCGARPASASGPPAALDSGVKTLASSLYQLVFGAPLTPTDSDLARAVSDVFYSFSTSSLNKTGQTPGDTWYFARFGAPGTLMNVVEQAVLRTAQIKNAPIPQTRAFELTMTSAAMSLLSSPTQKTLFVGLRKANNAALRRVLLAAGASQAIDPNQLAGPLTTVGPQPTSVGSPLRLAYAPPGESASVAGLHVAVLSGSGLLAGARMTTAPVVTPLVYTIQFSNLPSATGPTASVKVVCRLNPSMDPRSVVDGPKSIEGPPRRWPPVSISGSTLTWDLPCELPPGGIGSVSFFVLPAAPGPGFIELRPAEITFTPAPPAPFANPTLTNPWP